MKDSLDITRTSPGRLLYVGAAWVGAAGFFAGPAAVLIGGGRPLMAAVIGYAGIALFTGGIAARYDVVVARHPLLQLSANIAAATAVTSIFFLVFFLLYHL